jgi:Xaa-Pro aminopeptidase
MWPMELAPYEEPTVSRTVSFDFPQVYEKGMTIAFETHFGEPFVGGCRLENIIVVTDHGWENLYTMPDEEIIVPKHSLIMD